MKKLHYLHTKNIHKNESFRIFDMKLLRKLFRNTPIEIIIFTRN